MLKLKDVPKGSRARVVRAIGSVIKRYAMSDEFKRVFAERVASRPQDPTALPAAASSRTPEGAIRAVLLRFLTDTADVDWNAKVKKNINVFYFVDEGNEDQTLLWKACYRAGREATAAARKFAEDWLKELPASRR